VSDVAHGPLVFKGIHNKHSSISKFLYEIQIRKWANTHLWIYQRWDHVPRRSKHPLSKTNVIISAWKIFPLLISFYIDDMKLKVTSGNNYLFWFPTGNTCRSRNDIFSE
jgi:hypothetical protein